CHLPHRALVSHAPGNDLAQDVVGSPTGRGRRRYDPVLMTRTPVSSVDAAWLRMEDPTNLMMVTGVLFFEDRLDPQRLRHVLEERLLGFPRFRQRVEEPPLGLGPPLWVSDDRFDLDAHLHRVALPEPGDKKRLEALVSD